MSTRRIALLLACTLGAMAQVAHARSCPDRPVTLVVPTPAAQIGADIVAKAEPDGYTLLPGNIGRQAINPSPYRRLPSDPGNAFTPIALRAEPLARVQAQAGQRSYGSAGAGDAPHRAAERFKDRSGTFMLRVPYRGGRPATSDRIAGHVQLSFLQVLEPSGHIESGKLRALAVTSEHRARHTTADRARAPR